MFQWMKRKIIRQLPVPDQRPVNRRPQNAEPPYIDADRPPDIFGDLPPGYVPIESIFDTANIPGTTLYTGDIVRILQTPTGEAVDLHLKRGVPLGCGHSIFSVFEYLTEDVVYPGLGGKCSFCSATAAAKLKQGQITLAQAEAESHFCTVCARCCSDCHRSVCRRHARSFLEADGSELLLCPICLPKAKHGLLLSRVLAVPLIILFRR